MTRTALITGATGLVGSYVVERLVADGWSVRALVRNSTTASWIASMGAELAQGDVLDPRSLRDAAVGREVIIHAAALVTTGREWEDFRRLNVEGTTNAIEAAEHSGSRLLQVSSVAVYGMGARYRDTPTDENAPLAPLRPGNHYGRSKRESEQLVLRAHDDGRIWATAVRPSVVYGRRDRQFVPRVARLLRYGVMPLIGGGRAILAAVHAANVADGIARAAVAENAGGRAYNLANDYDVTVAEFVSLAALGLEQRVRTVPVALPVSSAAVAGLAWINARVRGPSFGARTRASLDFLTRDNPFNSDRARHELGWEPRMRPEIGVPEAFRWYKEERGEMERD